MGGEAAAEGGSGGGQVATVVLRASTDNLLDDLERAIDDGVNAYKVCYEMFGPNNHLSGFRREPADNMLSAPLTAASTPTRCARKMRSSSASKVEQNACCWTTWNALSTTASTPTRCRLQCQTLTSMSGVQIQGRLANCAAAGEDTAGA